MQALVQDISERWHYQLPEWKFTLLPATMDEQIVQWEYPTPTAPISRTRLWVTFTADSFVVDFEGIKYVIDQANDYECVNFDSFKVAKERIMRDVQKMLPIDYNVTVNKKQLDAFNVQENLLFARENADKILKSAPGVTKEKAFELLAAL